MHFSIPVTYNKPSKKLLLNSPCLQNEAAKKINCFLMVENTLLDSVAKQFPSQMILDFKAEREPVFRKLLFKEKCS